MNKGKAENKSAGLETIQGVQESGSNWSSMSHVMRKPENKSAGLETIQAVHESGSNFIYMFPMFIHWLPWRTSVRAQQLCVPRLQICVQ